MKGIRLYAIAFLAMFSVACDYHTRDRFDKTISTRYGRFRCQHVTGLGPVYEFDTQSDDTIAVNRVAMLESDGGIEFTDMRTGRRVVLKDSYGYHCERVQQPLPQPLPPVWLRHCK